MSQIALSSILCAYIYMDGRKPAVKNDAIKNKVVKLLLWTIFNGSICV